MINLRVPMRDLLDVCSQRINDCLKSNTINHKISLGLDLKSVKIVPNLNRLIFKKLNEQCYL